MEEIMNQRLKDWQDGIRSNGEYLTWLRQVQEYANVCLAEVARSILRDETKAGEKRIEKLFSVECPHCHWGFHSSVIEQHIRDKH